MLPVIQIKTLFPITTYLLVFVRLLAICHQNAYPNVCKALAHPKWNEAMIEEMQALEKNKSWALTSLPKGKRTVGCMCVFTLTYKPDGTIHIYKARLVAKRFTQSYGVDYFRPFLQLIN